MVLKYVSKEKSYRDVSNIIKKNYGNISLSEIEISTTIMKSIVSHLKGTKYGYASVIRRIITSDDYFKRLHGDNTGASGRRKNIRHQLLKILSLRNLDVKTVPGSYRKSASIYGLLCKDLQVENTFKNRNYIYLLWSQLRKLQSGETVIEEENNPSKGKMINIRYLGNYLNEYYC